MRSDGIVKKYAVIINGDTAERHLGNVELSAKVLKEMGYEVIAASPNQPIEKVDRFVAATAKNVEALADELANTVDGDDELFIYTTGHGDFEDGKTSVCLTDTCNTQHIVEKLDKIPFGQRTVVMDQCFGGNFASMFLNDPKTLFISSGSKDEKSCCGLFAPLFWSADAADENGDGAISWRERYSYTLSKQSYNSLTTQYVSTSLYKLGGKAELDDKVRTIEDKSAFREIVGSLKPGQYAVIMLGMEHCKACDKFEPKFDKSAEGNTSNRIYIKTKNTDIAADFGVSSFPTVIVIGWRGESVRVQDLSALEQGIADIVVPAEERAKRIYDAIIGAYSHLQATEMITACRAAEIISGDISQDTLVKLLDAAYQYCGQDSVYVFENLLPRAEPKVALSTFYDMLENMALWPRDLNSFLIARLAAPRIDEAGAADAIEAVMRLLESAIEPEHAVDLAIRLAPRLSAEKLIEFTRTILQGTFHNKLSTKEEFKAVLYGKVAHLLPADQLDNDLQFARTDSGTKLLALYAFLGGNENIPASALSAEISRLESEYSEKTRDADFTLMARSYLSPKMTDEQFTSLFNTIESFVDLTLGKKTIYASLYIGLCNLARTTEATNKKSIPKLIKLINVVDDYDAEKIGEILISNKALLTSKLAADAILAMSTRTLKGEIFNHEDLIVTKMLDLVSDEDFTKLIGLIIDDVNGKSVNDGKSASREIIYLCLMADRMPKAVVERVAKALNKNFDSFSNFDKFLFIVITSMYATNLDDTSYKTSIANIRPVLLDFDRASNAYEKLLGVLTGKRLADEADFLLQHVAESNTDYFIEHLVLYRSIYERLESPQRKKHRKTLEKIASKPNSGIGLVAKKILELDAQIDSKPSSNKK